MKNALLLLAVVCAVTGAAVAQDTQKALPAGDQEFIEKAASAGMLEVELGNLVSSKAQNEDIKRFAQAMVRDHSKANDELKSLLGSKNIAVPSEMKAEHKDQLTSMQTLEVAELEKQYKQKMVDNHKASIETFQKEANEGQDADIKGFASKTLPALQHHLQMAQLMAEGKRLGALPDHDPAAAPMGESPDIGVSSDVQGAPIQPAPETAPAEPAAEEPAQPEIERSEDIKHSEQHK